MDPQAPVAVRLAQIADSIAFATWSGTTDQRLQALSTHLAAVREVLGMEVAFVSQLHGERREFKVVSTSPEVHTQVQVGHSDRLLDTYCMYVLQGRLPPVIRDIHNTTHRAALLPITQRLGIGCYVSAPILLPNGRMFGTLCCFSRQARLDLVDDDGQALAEVARAIAAAVDESGHVGPLHRPGGQAG
jgi:GAF domain-containing protein